MCRFTFMITVWQIQNDSAAKVMSRSYRKLFISPGNPVTLETDNKARVLRKKPRDEELNHYLKHVETSERDVHTVPAFCVLYWFQVPSSGWMTEILTVQQRHWLHIVQIFKWHKKSEFISLKTQQLWHVQKHHSEICCLKCNLCFKHTNESVLTS